MKDNLTDFFKKVGESNKQEAVEIERNNQLMEIENQRRQKLLIESESSLLTFLKNKVHEISAESSLKTTVTSLIQEKIDSTEEEIPMITLITLLKTLNDSDNEKLNSIMGVIKQHMAVQQQNNQFNFNPVSRSGFANTDISKEELEKFKKVYKFLEKSKDIRDAEFSDDEN